jgi:serine/threonine protein kinase
MTPRAAPEVVNESLRQGGKLGYRLAADLWSVGVCAFVCLTGRFPFSRSVPIEERRPDPLVFFTAIEGSLEGVRYYVLHYSMKHFLC